MQIKVFVLPNGWVVKLCFVWLVDQWSEFKVNSLNTCFVLITVFCKEPSFKNSCKTFVRDFSFQGKKKKKRKENHLQKIYKIEFLRMTFFFRIGTFIINKFKCATESWHMFPGLVPSPSWQHKCGRGEKQFSSAHGHKTFTLEQVFAEAFLIKNEQLKLFPWALNDTRSFYICTYTLSHYTVAFRGCSRVESHPHTLLNSCRPNHKLCVRHNWLFTVQPALCLSCIICTHRDVSKSYKPSHVK